MASTSNRRTDGTHGRILNAANLIYSENQSLIMEIRKFQASMKKIAVELEKENQSEKVKKLEDGVIELLDSAEDCAYFATAVESVARCYEPGEELTNFKKLFEDEVVKIKASSSSNLQNQPILRQFKESVWNVHHAGQPMPGEEQEDIVMTSTQSNILNPICPLTGKPVTGLDEPVRRRVQFFTISSMECFENRHKLTYSAISMTCKHVYEKEAVMHYMKANSRCAMAGCPRMLEVGKVICDPLLVIELDEMRSMNKQTAQPTDVEDFTELDDDD